MTGRCCGVSFSPGFSKRAGHRFRSVVTAIVHPVAITILEHRDLAGRDPLPGPVKNHHLSGRSRLLQHEIQSPHGLDQVFSTTTPAGSRRRGACAPAPLRRHHHRRLIPSNKQKSGSTTRHARLIKTLPQELRTMAHFLIPSELFKAEYRQAQLKASPQISNPQNWLDLSILLNPSFDFIARHTGCVEKLPEADLAGR